MSPYTEKQKVVARIARHHPEKLYERNKGFLKMSKEELSEFEHTPTKKKKSEWKRSGGTVTK
jgi:hypothetical protein